MFVTLGFGSQMPLLRAIFRGLGTQTQGYKREGTKEKLPDSEDQTPRTKRCTPNMGLLALARGPNLEG